MWLYPALPILNVGETFSMDSTNRSSQSPTHTDCQDDLCWNGSRNPSFESIFAAVRTVQLAVFGCISIAADSSISPDKFCWFSIAAKHAIIPPMLKWVQKRLYNVFCKRVLIIQYCTSQYESHLISLQTVPVTMKKNVNSWETFFGWFQTKIHVPGSICKTKLSKFGKHWREG